VNIATIDRLYRAWSDGTIEMKRLNWSGAPEFANQPCEARIHCASPWIVISSPTQGLKAAAESNADEKVDVQDLTTILANWGDAPPRACRPRRRTAR
jgi:hypothetical protein